jgi:hypothetical protein
LRTQSSRPALLRGIEPARRLKSGFQRSISAYAEDRVPKLDVADYRQPTAAGYFSRVSKEQTLAAIGEACGADAKAGFATLKKAALADAAEKLLKGSRWLPELLQVGPQGAPGLGITPGPGLLRGKRKPRRDHPGAVDRRYGR